jgi:RNA polymerase sigma-70 factor, ECF subfamily
LTESGSKLNPVYSDGRVPAEQSTPDDRDIIREVQAGNSEQFTLLVIKYHRNLLNFIYRLVGNREIVEDIGQEVFLSIFKSIKTFDIGRGVPFAAWLFITARNRCISERRKKKISVLPIEKASSSLRSREKTPEQIASEEERLRAIRAALEQLPEPFQSTLWQSLRGDSPEEIADTNHISRGTVKSRLARAREKMNILLHEHWGGNPDGNF